MPYVGRPEAKTMAAPLTSACKSASRVRAVTSFLLLVSVPSRSSAMTDVFFVCIFCLDLEFYNEFNKFIEFNKFNEFNEVISL